MSNQEASRSLQRMVLADTRGPEPALPELGSRPFSPMPLAELRAILDERANEARRDIKACHADWRFSYIGGTLDGKLDALIELRKWLHAREIASGIGENVRI